MPCQAAPPHARLRCLVTPETPVPPSGYPSLRWTHSREFRFFFWWPTGLSPLLALERTQGTEAHNHGLTWCPGSVLAYLQREPPPASLSSGAALFPRGLEGDLAWHSLPLWPTAVSLSFQITQKRHKCLENITHLGVLRLAPDWQPGVQNLPPLMQSVKT